MLTLRRKAPPLILPALMLAGCHNNYVMPPPKPSVNVPNPHLRLMLEIFPQQVRQMDPATFRLRVSDAHDHPVDGASVKIDLIMPAMDMGKNTVTSRPQGAGIYAGTGRFGMDGKWNVIVTASQGGDKIVQTFPVYVR